MNHKKMKEVRLHGEIVALKNHISSLQFLLGKVWEGTKSKGKYQSLTKSIDLANAYVAEINLALIEIQKIEEGNI